MKQYIIILSLLLFVGFGGIFYSNGKVEKKETLYSRVIESGELNVGYISYGNSFRVDPNTGKYSGIFYEVIEEVGDRLDIEVNYVYELGWGDMILALNSGKVDIVVTGVWPTSSRSKWVDFTDPLYYSNVNGYVREGDKRFDNDLSQINNKKIIIGTIDGEMNAIIADSDFPLAQVSALTQQSDINQLLLDLESGKSDITFLEPAIALAYLEKNPGSIKQVEIDKPIRKFQNSMMVDKGEFEFLSMINHVFSELENEGFIDQILDKYEEFDGSFSRL